MNEPLELYVSNAVDVSNYIQMKVVKLYDYDNNEVHEFPVDVINVDGNIIGVAGNKEDYLQIWNSDSRNSQFGKLLGAYNPFEFTLKIIRKHSFTWLWGLPKYEIIDADGVSIADSNNEIILYQ